MASAAKKQDMPPPGGYRTINFARIPAKQYFSGSRYRIVSIQIVNTLSFIQLEKLRRNRDEEAKLMANVPGWEVGTLYGEPIYKSVTSDTLMEPHPIEFYVHAPYKSYAERLHMHLWS
ncbi:hypothetical protein B566_EDAN008675 [Ephemera danica]|nr:hypothetical protein B566_EDAN008675 [Ephemera danica]